MDYATAQMHLKATFDSAFAKSAGSKAQRVAMANRCVRMVPCAERIALMVWAADYCANWGGA